LLYARWWSWYGGAIWGPRFLLPAIPAFAPALAVAFQRWRRSPWVQAAVIVSAIMSLFGVWVTIHPELNSYVAAPIRTGNARQVMAQVTDPRYVTQTDSTMFDWSLFPFGHGNPHSRADRSQSALAISHGAASDPRIADRS